MRLIVRDTEETYEFGEYGPEVTLEEFIKDLEGTFEDSGESASYIAGQLVAHGAVFSEFTGSWYWFE